MLSVAFDALFALVDVLFHPVISSNPIMITVPVKNWLKRLGFIFIFVSFRKVNKQCYKLVVISILFTIKSKAICNIKK
jgi:hypothetical protein